jgi:hypothetical protein
MLGAGKVLVSDNSLVCDMIPVDYVVNLIIVVAWYTALNRYQVFYALASLIKLGSSTICIFNI